MQNASLKILAAKNIPGLFNDFPDLEEAAINAVYDLCDDQSAIVRVISKYSRSQRLMNGTGSKGGLPCNHGTLEGGE